MANFFARTLFKWHLQNPRPLPWSVADPNPYHIWLSEIIMQQTRVQQGTGYYLRFIQQFPTVQSLAFASEDDVLRLWQGLGYYTRARNLHKAAKYIVDDLNAQFPGHYAELIKLPGVGPYSAAAISSFAYGHRHVVVDGNVKRFISRVAGIKEPVDEPRIHKQIHDLAFDFMKDYSPAIFNQAIMNFGALICKPKLPLCTVCPFARHCYAKQNEVVALLPQKTRKRPPGERFFHFAIIRYRNQLLLQKRMQDDIWKGLYCLPVLEAKSLRSPGRLALLRFVSSIINSKAVQVLPATKTDYQQVLTHQVIHGRFHPFKLTRRSTVLPSNYKWVALDELDLLGKPKILVQYFLDTLPR